MCFCCCSLWFLKCTVKLYSEAAVEFMMVVLSVVFPLRRRRRQCCLCVYENGIKLQHQFLFYYLLYWHFLACDAIKFLEHNILILESFFAAAAASSSFKTIDCSIGKWIMHILTIFRYVFLWEVNFALHTRLDSYDNNSCLLDDKELENDRILGGHIIIII